MKLAKIRNILKGAEVYDQWGNKYQIASVRDNWVSLKLIPLMLNDTSVRIDAKYDEDSYVKYWEEGTWVYAFKYLAYKYQSPEGDDKIVTMDELNSDFPPVVEALEELAKHIYIDDKDQEIGWKDHCIRNTPAVLVEDSHGNKFNLRGIEGGFVKMVPVKIVDFEALSDVGLSTITSDQLKVRIWLKRLQALAIE